MALPEKRVQYANAPSSFTNSPEPVWDFAQLFPAQGQWDEEDYFAIETTQLIEFSHGQLVDPEYKTVTVLSLPAATTSESYSVYGEFKAGEQAHSHLLAGFQVDVDELFASGELQFKKGGLHSRRPCRQNPAILCSV